ncbi:DNA cytosine methyltransferase [Pseudonocardia pini]|uniref:DNA cytosine methyltransferase n=1 Tax=Pseudonocardia pini TaxID=2758030 RepID=UPI0015F0C3D1|nr:DNA cytosine methyltransferase [Pseudonocardia pini]
MITPGHQVFRGLDGGWRYATPDERFVRIDGPDEVLAMVADPPHDPGPRFAQLVAALTDRGVLVTDVAAAPPVARVRVEGSGPVADRVCELVGGSADTEPEVVVSVAGWLPDEEWCARDAELREQVVALPERPATTELPAARTEFFGQSVPGVFKWLDLHFGRTPRELSLQRYDHVPPGGGRFDLPAELLPRCWREKKTGTTDVMGRLRWDQPSLTIRTEFFKPEKGRYLHPQWDRDDPANRVNRVITHLEAALLQGFPETFAWCGSKVRIAKQIGNAVPVGLSSAIAGQVLQRLR